MKAIAAAARTVARMAKGVDLGTLDTNRGWAPVGGYGGPAGRPAQIAAAINSYGATEQSSAIVFGCVTLIADTLAGYEAAVVDEKGDIVEPGATDQDLFDLLSEPSPELTYPDFVADTETDLCLVGNSWWLKEEINRFGQPLYLERFQPSTVKIATDQRDRKIGYIVTIKGHQIPFGLDDVMHFRTRNPLNKHYGMGVVEALLRELNLDLATSAHITSFFTNGARIAGVLTVAEEMDDKQFERLKRQVDEQYGGPSNAYKTLIAEKSSDFKPIQPPPAALGVVDLAHLGEDRVLKGFGVPAFMLGGREEGGVPKMEQSQHIFFRRMLPRANRFQTRLTLDLVSLWEGRKFVIYPDANEPPAVKYENGTKLAQTWAAVNEVRAATGQPEIDDPRYDVPVPPGTVHPEYVMSPIPDRSTPPGGKPPGAPGGGPPADSPDQQPTQTSSPVRFRSRRAPNVQTRVKGSVLPLPPGRRVRGISAATKAIMQSQQLALPPAGEVVELVEAPELPEGYEQRATLIDPGEVEAGAATALLQGQARFFYRATPRIQSVFVDFFNGQRNRVLDNLSDYRGASARSKGRSEKAELTGGDDLWQTEAEREALQTAYLALLDELGPEAFKVPARLVNLTLSWDVEHEWIKAARDRLAEKVVRINETTRNAIAEEVAEGLRRGYSIPRIANGYSDEAFRGIRGVFDQASTARAETIARTETAMMFNASASAAYRTAGIQYVSVFDGSGDPGCAEAAGSRWTLDQADDNPIEHPNCVRAFAPLAPGEQ